MDANPHAVGDEPDDEVFGPIEDGEEVFEWIDDSGAELDGDAASGKVPAPSLRERVAMLRAGAVRLRRDRRKIAAVAASVVLAAAIGAGATAWFDGVAGASDRAAVVALSVDSVTDGDPTAAKYDATATTATGEYVVEFANNGPDAVTLASVGFDAGTLMRSTGWRPVGTARIPAGATAKVALTVRLFCPMVAIGVQTGGFGAARGIDGGTGSMPFPALDVKVRDGNGDERAVTLSAHVPVSSQLRSENGELTFLGSGVEPSPQIVTADAGICEQWTTDRIKQQQERDRQDPLADLQRPSPGLAFSYDKVLSPAAHSAFTLGITVKNVTDHALTLNTRPDAAFLENPRLKTEWLPTRLDLAAGQSQTVRLTVTVDDCSNAELQTGVEVLAEAVLEVDDPATAIDEPVYPEQSLTGSLHLASDAAQQMKAACA